MPKQKKQKNLLEQPQLDETNAQQEAIATLSDEQLEQIAGGSALYSTPPQLDPSNWQGPTQRRLDGAGEPHTLVHGGPMGAYPN